MKYFILIREWFKESQNVIPEYIDETIFYLGSSYAFIWKNIGTDIFFNGNYHSENKHLGYAIDEMENPGPDVNQAMENIEDYLEDFNIACLESLIDITKGKVQ